MNRIAITGTSGQWFDLDKAKHYEENSYWDGSNHISKVTNSQWDHESIYFTAGGKFILNSWSNVQGGSDTYEIISEEEAAKWFAKQSFPDDEIPEILLENYIYKLEIV